VKLEMEREGNRSRRAGGREPFSLSITAEPVIGKAIKL
jgi:hypothetical protein